MPGTPNSLFFEILSAYKTIDVKVYDGERVAITDMGGEP